MAPKDEEIRHKGLLALRKALGRAGMIRFLQQLQKGTGDYAEDRRAWVDKTTLDELREATLPARKPKERASKIRRHSR